jgi:hypothetical protein
MSTEITIVGVARPNSESLRATIPRGIVVFLGVENGDQLEWKMEVDSKNGNRVAVVRKMEIDPRNGRRVAAVRKP